MGSIIERNKNVIISMRTGAKPEEVDHVCERIIAFGNKPHKSVGSERVIIGVVGKGDLDLLFDSVQLMPGVENAVRISAPYKFVSSESKQGRTVVRVKDLEIGGTNLVIIAGPCAVESEEQMTETALGVKKSGAHILRGGAFKPRSSPYEFQGLHEEGLKILAGARERTKMPIVTEIMDSEDVELVAKYADILQVGARNMQNFSLLKKLGKISKPVLLKRGISANIKELLLSAEYIVAGGNPNVILCLRGIRTFETETRNTADIDTISILKEKSHLPVIFDPSHAAGRRDLVPVLARAAVAAGADGLIIEVHPEPEKALSDGPQSLTLEQFSVLMDQVQKISAVMKTI